MSCYHPIKGFHTSGGVVFSEASIRGADYREVWLPCGRCLGCLERRASDWAVRVMHEAQMWEENCCVTLTYGRNCLPPGSFLEYRDFQLFMMRLRKYCGVSSERPANAVRFFMCGEYGPLNLRPHYHSCLFNVDFRDGKVCGKSDAGAVFYDSPILSRIWTHGNVSVQELNSATAMYVARYVVKKLEVQNDSRFAVIVDSDGVVRSRPDEFSHCSLKPGIGSGWFRRFGSDVAAVDGCVVSGDRKRVPKYYDKLRRRSDAFAFEEVQAARVAAAKVHWEDQSEERLSVREVVHRARVVKQKRSFE